jgi:tetratricopeptide (TPR) repeat protein
MSAEAEEEVAAADICCASCGQAEIDDIKLKDCDGGCDLVKYCSDGCQNSHRDQHEEECKQRLAEIRERDLFTMPDESHMGECPLCCLPLSLDLQKSVLMSCCCKSICNGCDYANKKREHEAGLKQRCAFCREPAPRSEEECDKRVMKRIKKNCPVAMCQMGNKHGDEGDHETAFKYLKRAAELGDADAHYQLSRMHFKGEGVEKDEEKGIYHWEEAAVAGHPTARFNLGIEERNNGNFERAKEHFIISANLGYHDSLKLLMALYKEGHASKEDYADALRAYQAAVDATKSPERKKAEDALKSGRVRVIC